MKIVLPIKPLSINDCFQGRHFQTKACRVYNKALDIHLLPFRREAIAAQWYQVSYKFYLKNFGNSDWDNMVKVLQDGLTRNGFFSDDKKIKRAHVEKFKSPTDRIEVEILPYTEEI